MYYLLLDDTRTAIEISWVKLPEVEWTIVKSYNEFVSYIQTHGLPDFVSFDHDLGIEQYIDPEEIDPEMIFSEKNGYDCAKWLVNYCMEHHRKFPEYTVHSMNCIGKTNIISYIENAKKCTII